jgi:hypothetical protein
MAFHIPQSRKWDALSNICHVSCATWNHSRARMMCHASHPACVCALTNVLDSTAHRVHAQERYILDANMGDQDGMA